MDSTRSGTRERSVRWLASAGVGVVVSLLLTGSRAGLASAAAAMFLGVHAVGRQRLVRGSTGSVIRWMPWPVPGRSAGGSQVDLTSRGLVRATRPAAGTIVCSIRRGGGLTCRAVLN
jgi:hypothetical protein